jgi:hypothetical protein
MVGKKKKKKKIYLTKPFLIFVDFIGTEKNIPKR